MVTRIPEGVYTMNDIKRIIQYNAKVYQQASKRVKSQMLDELSHLVHRNRQYVAFLLRMEGKEVYRRGDVRVVVDTSKQAVRRRGRKRVYDEEVLRALRHLWVLSGYASSKHLVAFIRKNQECLFTHPELQSVLSERVKALLVRISPSTVDRLMKPYRSQWRGKKRRSHPFSSQLKRSVAVEAWYERPRELGYVEVDLVHHSGASAAGDFAYTLTATEVRTGWTELRALRNKAMVWTRQALAEIVRSMPMTVRSIHSDNGSEFLNAHVQRFCREVGIGFTRSRPYHKNDAPHVESRNWSLVRAYVGWRRYDSEEELAVLDRLLRCISLRHNLFMPTMRLVERRREGGRVYRRYEMDTPLGRLLGLLEDEEAKEALRRYAASVDIVALCRQIESLAEDLDAAYAKKKRRLEDV